VANFSILNEIPIGAVIANAFAGSAFEFLGRDSRVTIAQTCEAAGVSTITSTIQFGAEVQLEEGAVNVEALAGRGPLMPEDIVVDDVAAAGDRLVSRLTSTNAAIIDVRTKVRIIPV